MNYIDVAPIVLKITMKTIPQRQGLSQAMEHPAPEIAFFSPCTFAVKILKQMEQNEVESKGPGREEEKPNGPELHDKSWSHKLSSRLG